MTYYRNAKHPAKYNALDQQQTRTPDMPEMEPRKHRLQTGIGLFFFAVFCIMFALVVVKWWGLA